MTPQLFAVDGGADDEPEEFEDLPPDPVSESQARSTLHGKEFDSLAFDFLEEMGATIVERYTRFEGYPLDALVQGATGRRFYVDARGTPDPTDRPKAGLRRQDTVLKFGFKALRLEQRGSPHPLLLLTSHMPKAGSSSEFLLSELRDAVFDVVPISGDLLGRRRLQHYFGADELVDQVVPWRSVQLGFDFELSLDEDEGDHADA